MKHLLATTALVAAFALSSAQAQTTTSATISPPEGFVESNAVLTSDKLEGMAVYDANNDEIGKIHGLIFANGTTSVNRTGNSTDASQPSGDKVEAVGSRDMMKSDNRDAAAAADAKDDGATPAGQDIDSTNATDTTPDGSSTTAGETAGTQSDTDSTTSATSGSADSDTADSTDAASTDSTTAEATSATDTDNADADSSPTSTDGSAAAPTDTETSTTDQGVAADSTGSTNTEAGTVQGDADHVQPTTSDTAATQRDDAGTAMGMDDAKISHAIIDVGGFLGLGAHRVAVPIEDLVIYADGDDYRVYLPWTRDQLKEMPEFDEDRLDTITR